MGGTPDTPRVPRSMEQDKPNNGYDRLDRLIGRHRGLIRRLCWRGAHGNEAQCDDLVQDCYVALWQRIGALRSNVSRLEEAAWVVWNCRDVLSHHKRRPAIETETLDPHLADTLVAPDDHPNAEFIEELATCLNDRERLALTLMLRDLTDLEIAEHLGMRVDSFQRMRLRMIAKLKNNNKI